MPGETPILPFVNLGWLQVGSSGPLSEQQQPGPPDGHVHVRQRGVIDPDPSQRSTGLAAPVVAGITRLQPRSEVFACPRCEARLASQSLLDYHLAHAHSRPYPCTASDDCGQAFDRSTDLARHIDQKHRKVRDFPCPHDGCKYSRSQDGGFARKEQLTRHLGTRHPLSPYLLSQDS